LSSTSRPALGFLIAANRAAQILHPTEEIRIKKVDNISLNLASYER